MTRILVLVYSSVVLGSPMVAQAIDQLSPAEIKAAVSAKPGTGSVYIEDAGFTTPSFCKAQMPALLVYTPAGWLAVLSSNARKQYLQFQPSPSDTRRVLTIIGRGCANGTAAGPVCDSITRIALLSDMHGTIVVEAVEQNPVTQAWQNGFGASAVCSSLVSKFPMSDVQKVRNPLGEFLVATFNGSQLLKIYRVKEKYLKKLDIASLQTSAARSAQASPTGTNSALEEAIRNSEASEASPAAAASLADVGHVLSPQELADLVQQGQASRCAVVTVPPGAEVEIDGNKAGVSPLAFVLLKRGEKPRTVTIKMAGYKTVENKFLPDGKTIPITVTLEKQQGFRADYQDYRLFVEATDEGWQVRIYHVPGKKWVYQEAADGPDAGKSDAITTAVLSDDPKATLRDIEDAKASLNWQSYVAESK